MSEAERAERPWSCFWRRADSIVPTAEGAVIINTRKDFCSCEACVRWSGDHGPFTVAVEKQSADFKTKFRGLKLAEVVSVIRFLDSSKSFSKISIE